MATQKYHLHLKGYVGGYDFDSDYVDYVLSKNSENEVHVLIDSWKATYFQSVRCGFLHRICGTRTDVRFLMYILGAVRPFLSSCVVSDMS